MFEKLKEVFGMGKRERKNQSPAVVRSALAVVRSGLPGTEPVAAPEKMAAASPAVPESAPVEETPSAAGFPDALADLKSIVQCELASPGIDRKLCRHLPNTHITDREYFDLPKVNRVIDGKSLTFDAWMRIKFPYWRPLR